MQVESEHISHAQEPVGGGEILVIPDAPPASLLKRLLRARREGRLPIWSCLMTIRWRLRGVKAPLSAVIQGKVWIENPRQLTMGRHSWIGRNSYIRCVPGTISLGDYTSISEGSWINAMESVRIGSYSGVSPGCHVTDANHGIAPGILMRMQSRTAAPVTIGDGTWLAAGSKVLSGVTVGRGVVVAAGAVVTKDVPDYAIVGGVPARVIGSREPSLVSPAD